MLEQHHTRSVTAAEAVGQGLPAGLCNGDGILFWWPVPGRDKPVPQFRPDAPVVIDGEESKYVFPKGCGSFVAVFREPTEGARVLIAEGTKQSLAALSWAPPEWGVAGVPGCSNWIGTDLDWAEDRPVVVMFDKDTATNRDVYDAASELRDALLDAGATEVKFARLAGAGATDGLDDVLGRKAPDKRTAYLERVADRAPGKLGRRPAKRRSKYFDERDGLLAETLSKDVMDGHPCALTAEQKIAGYVDGVFQIDGTFVLASVRRLLGEQYRPVWKSTVEESVRGILIDEGRVIPDTLSEPLLNCANGMLNLMTGELLEHDPKYLSRSQIPVPWLPDATCPQYEAWLKQVCPDQADELENVVSLMLDQSRTPTKAAFLFGPPRSGKSTFLRIIKQIAGEANCSAVDLHQLADDKFTAAHLYGKMVNLSADPSSKDVADIRLFKKMTGVDMVTADHKYGQPFDFTATALFAFSANNIPHVSDPSGAYMERIRPFWFGHSVAGREDLELESRLAGELPGILVRWVKAWQAHYARGGYLAANRAVTEQFVVKSDRVARWVADYCTVTPAEPRSTLPAEQTATTTELFQAFTRQQKQDGGLDMGRDGFKERLLSVTGVVEVRRQTTRALALNVRAGTVHRDERGAEAGEAGGVSPLLYRAQIQPAKDQDRADEVSGRPVEKGATSPASPASVADRCQMHPRCPAREHASGCPAAGARS
ncbi:phage/plasmid primase, P4 family [Streptomyces sp. NBC_01092]|uniref:DNA primase family protein n=1 Tax=Streptomyces sp. NBC_01092 TaxID=2903748 RepID=UPI00386F1473|nr:phage/plasmid primase, P4 family [Streptomyces sp. NBC_01092]